MRERETHLNDTLLDELREANPVQSDALPSSRDPLAARTLEEIVTSDGPSPYPSVSNAAARVDSVRRRHRRQVEGERADPVAVAKVDCVRRRHHRIGSVAAAVVVVVAAGVGVFAIDFGTAPDATAEVHRAAEASAVSAAESMRWHTKVTVGLADPDRPLEFSIAGTVSGGNSEITWQSHSDLSSVGMDEIGPVTAVAVDGEVYISVAEGVWEGPQPMSEFSLLSGITADALIGDIGQLTDFTKIGVETIDGETCTRYQSPAAPNNAIRSILILALGFAQFPIDTGQTGASQSPDPVYLNVWIDSDDLICRISFGDDALTAGSFTAVTDFERLSEPVEIAKPIA